MIVHLKGSSVASTPIITNKPYTKTLKACSVHSTDWGLLRGYNVVWVCYQLSEPRSILWIKNKVLRIVATVLFFLGVVSAFSQRPIITSVETSAGYPLHKIQIVGSGFSSNTADLQVWFDQVKGTIVSSTDNFIELNVPPPARLHNVEVLHVGSRLSSKSPLKFMPVFSGEGFATSKLTAPLSFSSTTSIFDLCACDLTNDNSPELIGTKFE